MTKQQKQDHKQRSSIRLRYPPSFQSPSSVSPVDYYSASPDWGGGGWLLVLVECTFGLLKLHHGLGKVSWIGEK